MGLIEFDYSDILENAPVTENEGDDVLDNVSNIEGLPNTTILRLLQTFDKLIKELQDGKQDTLTSQQIVAINSGINAVKVALIQTNADDIATLKAIKYGANLSASMDSSTFVLTLQLKDQDNNNLGTAQTIDLPLESVVVSGSYDDLTKSLILTLQSGSTITIPVSDLISGLQPLIDSDNKLDADLVDDTTSTNKFVTSAEKTTWSGKQDANQAVLYTQAQTLTEPQKLQARQNIGAGSSGFSGDYDDLTSRPTLDTTQTTSQTTSASETITGNIKFHKISKTGSLADAIDDSTHRVVTDTEKSTWSGKCTLDEVYPVGAIYWTYNDATSPASLFGGSWANLITDSQVIQGGTIDIYGNGNDFKLRTNVTSPKTIIVNTNSNTNPNAQGDLGFWNQGSGATGYESALRYPTKSEISSGTLKADIDDGAKMVHLYAWVRTA